MGKVSRIFVPEEKNTKRYTTVSEWKKKDNMELHDIEKKCKEQFHIHDAEGLFESSASGHLFKPLIIGKARRSIALAHLDKEVTYVPVHYYFNDNAWMTTKIFEYWFTECFLSDIEPTVFEANLKLLHNINKKRSFHISNNELASYQLHYMLSEDEKDEHSKIIKDLENMRIKCFEIVCIDILANPRVHEEEPIAHTSDLPDLV